MGVAAVSHGAPSQSTFSPTMFDGSLPLAGARGFAREKRFRIIFLSRKVSTTSSVAFSQAMSMFWPAKATVSKH